MAAVILENYFITLGDVIVKTDTHEVFKKGKKIWLRKKEYLLLEFLARNKGQMIDRLSILEYVWNYDNTINTNTLDVHMAALRRKIDLKINKKIIKTVRGQGYEINLNSKRNYLFNLLR